jgi:hypothetical protein
VSTVTPTVTPSRNLTIPHDFAQPSLTHPLTPVTPEGWLTLPYREIGKREGQYAHAVTPNTAATSTPPTYTTTAPPSQ